MSSCILPSRYDHLTKKFSSFLSSMIFVYLCICYVEKEEQSSGMSLPSCWANMSNGASINCIIQ